MHDATMYTTKAILILDNDGERLIAEYFDKNLFPDTRTQKSFESKLFKKTCKDQDSEIVLLDDLTIIYKSNVDLFFYIIGDAQENELILANLLSTLYEAISIILQKNVEKACLLNNLSQILLLIDEMIDDGIVLDMDLESILGKLGMGGSGNSAAMNMSQLVGLDAKAAEATVNNVLQQAKEFKWGSFMGK